MKILVLQNHEVERFDIFREYLPKDAEITIEFQDEIGGNHDFDSLVILGGPQGVYDKDVYKYLNRELDIIKYALNQNKRILGISLGAQLLSVAAGGYAGKGSFGPEIGVIKITLLGDMNKIGNEIPVLLWHRDTFSVPPGGQLLGYSNMYFQAFKVKRAIGIQFHLEVDENIISEWISSYGEADKDIIRVWKEKGKTEEDLIQIIKENKQKFRESLKAFMGYWLSL